MKTAALALVVATVVILASCSVPDGQAEVGTRPNLITADARVVPAAYGNDYPYQGNIILRYTDFDVVMVGAEPWYLPAEITRRRRAGAAWMSRESAAIASRSTRSTAGTPTS